MEKIMEKITYISINNDGKGGGPGHIPTLERMMGDVVMSPHRPLRPDEQIPEDLCSFVTLDPMDQTPRVPVCLFGL